MEVKDKSNLAQTLPSFTLGPTLKQASKRGGLKLQVNSTRWQIWTTHATNLANHIKVVGKQELWSKGKMVGQVKQGIQNWNQQATTKFSTSYQTTLKEEKQEQVTKFSKWHNWKSQSGVFF